MSCIFRKKREGGTQTIAKHAIVIPGKPACGAGPIPSRQHGVPCKDVSHSTAKEGVGGKVVASRDPGKTDGGSQTLDTIQKQIRNCTDAIAEGEQYPSLMEKLAELERDQAAVTLW